MHRDPENGDPPTFAAAAHHWLAIDLDQVGCPDRTDPVTDPEGAIEYLISQLPPEVGEASCWWQFTSSQSLRGHTGLSARVWYWSGEQLDDGALARWAEEVNARAGRRLVDPALYSPVQAHYVCSPLFRGMADPIPVRSGIRCGLLDKVTLRIPAGSTDWSDNIAAEDHVDIDVVDLDFGDDEGAGLGDIRNDELSSNRPAAYWREMSKGVCQGRRHRAMLELSGLLFGMEQIEPFLAASLIRAFAATYCDPPFSPSDELEEIINYVCDRECGR